MQMLEAGGLPPLTDKIRKADDDNPRGYYEFERVKKVKTDASWLDDCHSKVVKMVSMLLFDLPPTREYQVIFMQRNMNEILSSQNAMLKRQVKHDGGIGDDEMAGMFHRHLEKVKNWLITRENFEVLFVNHHEAVTTPEAVAEKVNVFLGGRLDEARMAGVVDAKLYRQRAGRN